MKIIVSLLALSALFVACSPKSTPVGDKKQNSRFPNEIVEEGYNLFSINCIKCHEAQPIKNYTREQWDRILPSMAAKAVINTEQSDKINSYINWELGQ